MLLGISSLTPLEAGQALVDGTLLGLTYTALSIGLTLTMGVLRVVNVAHTAFVMLGSFFALELHSRFGLDPIAAFVIALPVFFAIGAVVERGMIQHVERNTETVGLLILFGLMVTIQSAASKVWTTDTRVLTTGYTNGHISIGPLIVADPRLIAGGLALAMALLLHVFLRYTLAGKAIRAMAENRDAASIMGIDVRRMSMIVFGVGIATAGAGGVALAMIYPFDPQTHIQWLAWAFIVVVIGGLGGVKNTLIGGLSLGLIQAYAARLFPFQYTDLVLYLVLAAMLLVRGRGLVGAQARAL